MFYVTAIRGARMAWLAGPFDAREEAARHVAAARIVACALDPWCDFDAFGVTGLEGPAGYVGRLHGLMGF